VGWPGEVVTVPHDYLPTPGLEDANWDQDLVTDTERIRRELGFGETVSREEAIQRTAEWERENPPESTEEIFDYAAEDAALARARA
jgi:nucleoside-diphosphate-sugar epimerase